jgi:hypothetical protein
VNVGQTGTAIDRIRILAGRRRPVLLSRHRIDRDLAHVAFADELVERLRQASLCRRQTGLSAKRILKRLSRSTVSRVCMIVRWYCGNAIDARMMMIEITIINSSNVKPAAANERGPRF